MSLSPWLQMPITLKSTQPDAGLNLGKKDSSSIWGDDVDILSEWEVRIFTKVLTSAHNPLSIACTGAVSNIPHAQHAVPPENHLPASSK